jgi:hypothetical protein
MKNFLIAPILMTLIFGCSNKNYDNVETKSLSDIEKVAKAYGFENFNKIKQLQYTFNVARYDTLLVARSWLWNKETGDITMINNQDTVTYRQANITDELKKADHRFINDKYWLLFPFQLIWDSNMSYKNMGSQKAPISGNQLIKLTVQYGDDGGYTPGDAYDLYLDKDWIIREWEFRKTNKEAPGSAITWEGYTIFNGITVATEHNNKDSGLRIYFTDVKFE